jgi:THO complex subunit 2
VKLYGRYIGKVVHSNPVVAFTNILDQIQVYDNHIPFIVDASRYLTDLSFDIFGFTLIEALASGKDRLESDGTSVKLWVRDYLKYFKTNF